MAPTNVRAASTAEAPQPAGRYSQAIVASQFCFLAGQGPLDADGTVQRGPLESQLRLCFNNLEAVAQAAGTSLDHAVRIGVYVRPGTDLVEYNRVYAELVTADPAPARTTIFSPFSDFDVEVDAICLVPE
jgi:enamine deaminase RidA (YjgF/YER057c/UK114 family)